MGRHNLLLVDGDTRNRRVLEVSLRKAGFLVSTAESGQEALSRIRLAAPDLVVSDTQLPDMDGFAFCGELKSDPELARIPLVFLTADRDVKSRIRGLELGVEDYLTRPIFVKEIVVRIRMILQRRQRELLAEGGGRQVMRGDLTDATVVDLIQTLETGGRSGIIHFRSLDGRRGAIYFRDGQVIDAEHGRLQGIPAVYRLLGWAEGAFEVEFRTIRRREAITEPTQTLLMEGMRRVDEWGRLLEQLPPLNTVFEVDYAQLAQRLGEIPDEMNATIRLIDGRRSLMQVIDDNPLDDLSALAVIGRLYFEGLIFDTGSEGPLAEASGPQWLPPLGEGPADSRIGGESGPLHADAIDLGPLETGRGRSAHERITNSGLAKVGFRAPLPGGPVRAFDTGELPVTGDLDDEIFGSLPESSHPSRASGDASGGAIRSVPVGEGSAPTGKGDGGVAPGASAAPSASPDAGDEAEEGRGIALDDGSVTPPLEVDAPSAFDEEIVEQRVSRRRSGSGDTSPGLGSERHSLGDAQMGSAHGGVRAATPKATPSRTSAPAQPGTTSSGSGSKSAPEAGDEGGQTNPLLGRRAAADGSGTGSRSHVIPFRRPSEPGGGSSRVSQVAAAVAGEELAGPEYREERAAEGPSQDAMPELASGSAPDDPRESSARAGAEGEQVGTAVALGAQSSAENMFFAADYDDEAYCSETYDRSIAMPLGRRAIGISLLAFVAVGSLAAYFWWSRTGAPDRQAPGSDEAVAASAGRAPGESPARVEPLVTPKEGLAGAQAPGGGRAADEGAAKHPPARSAGATAAGEAERERTETPVVKAPRADNEAARSSPTHEERSSVPSERASSPARKEARPRPRPGRRRSRVLAATGECPVPKGASYRRVIAAAHRLLDRDRLAEAYACFELAQSRNPRGWQALEGLALKQLELGNTNAALYLARRSIAINRRAPLGHLVAGTVYAELPGKSREARAALERYLRYCRDCRYASEIRDFLLTMN